MTAFDVGRRGAQSTREHIDKGSLTVVILTMTTVICQHLQIASIANFPVTVGAISGILLLVSTISRPPYTTIALATAGIVAWTGASAVSQDLTGNEALQFWRTLGLIVATTSILLASTGTVRNPAVTLNSLRKGLFASLVLITALSVLQVITGTQGQTTFFNPWGNLQYLYKYDPHLQFNPVPRAQGFYLEPSYLAFVTGSVAVALLLLRHRITWVIVLSIVAMVSSRSATGLILAVLISALFIARSRLVVTLTLASLLIPAAVLVGPYLSERLGSVSEEGSSANYRLVAPLQVLVDTLSTRPLGWSLGSIDQVLPRYGLLNGTNVGGSLDNGMYVIIFYFGWAGVVLLLAAFCMAYKKVASRVQKDSLSWVTPIWLIGSLSFSGGIFLPEFAVMSAIVVIANRLHAANLLEGGDKWRN